MAQYRPARNSAISMDAPRRAQRKRDVSTVTQSGHSPAEPSGDLHVGPTRRPESSFRFRGPNCRFVRRSLAAPLFVGAVLALSLTALAPVAASSTRHANTESAGPGSRLPPLVQRTGKPPTGYQVTFRYWAPIATSVRIEGEWYFSSPARTTMASSEGLLPSQWRAGDFPITYPNSTARNWPVAAMAEDHRTGVWYYTAPLPSGVFTYGFYIDCPDPSGQSCTEVSDPSNPPWNTRHGVALGSVEASSQVYVSSDPAFGTVDYWWQGPARTRGKLVDLSYPSSPAKEAAGANRLAVYTPPGYDPRRSTLYPTLYLIHGGPGNEVDWSTRGDAANILDNLVGTAQVKPMVVVMTNFNGFAYGCGEPGWALDYDQDLIDNVIPYVQAHYHVSREASQRAFAGLSCGGYLASSLLFGHPRQFGYYAVMSPIAFSATVSPAQVTALRRVGILVGGGRQDPIFAYAAAELADLESQGIRPISDLVNGGHEWYVWRILLRDFLTRVAFSPVAAHS